MPNATVQKCSCLNSSTPSSVDASLMHLSSWPIMCEGVVYQTRQEKYFTIKMCQKLSLLIHQSTSQLPAVILPHFNFKQIWQNTALKYYISYIKQSVTISKLQLSNELVFQIHMMSWLLSPAAGSFHCRRSLETLSHTSSMLSTLQPTCLPHSNSYKNHGNANKHNRAWITELHTVFSAYQHV